jgi:sporadic carbohydrate cluster 2OG-Fe(II) oxygenase
MMQKNINLSIQYPKDSNSLLPIHSDVWSGDSSFEINLWLPLVNCYGTKSMYILEQKHNKSFLEFMKKNNLSSSKEIFKVLKNKVKWLKLDYGEFLIFNQSLPHGNVVNLEKETRWSMNCRFKSFFSPYGDKKIGEFFLPITTRAITEVGMNFEYPFKKQ